MTSDPYRIAYEQASDELKEIGDIFTELRLRKDKIERVILAFKPLLETSDSTAHVEKVSEKVAESLPPEQPEEVADTDQVSAATDSNPSTYSFLEVPAPLPELPPGPSDPFQRRVFRFRGLSNEHRGVQRGA